MESNSGRLECLRFLRLPNTTVFADKISATRSCRSTCAVAPHARTVHHNSGRPKAASRIGRLDLGSTDRAALRNEPDVSNHLGTLTLEIRIHIAVENTLHEICWRLVSGSSFSTWKQHSRRRLRNLQKWRVGTSRSCWPGWTGRCGSGANLGAVLGYATRSSIGHGRLCGFRAYGSLDMFHCGRTLTRKIRMT